MTDLGQIKAQVQQVKARIAQAAKQAGRRAEDITLVAATKMNTTQRIRVALEAGVDASGENRVQELLTKFAEHAYTGKPLHFIGRLQRNKVKFLVGKVDLIHSVDSLALAQAIAKEAKKQGIRQDILLEVNIAGECSKGGFSPCELEERVQEIAKEPALCVRGLMTIAPIVRENEKNTVYFRAMHQLFIDISSKKYDNTNMNILSMGMSGDFEDAIAEGATMVRVGSAIFGKRVPQVDTPSK